MINIEEDNLKNVIKRNSKFILKRRFPIESLIGLGVYITSYYLADFNGKPVLEVFAKAVSVAYSLYIAYLLFKFFTTSFSDEILFEQIMGVVEKKHAFSLCVIKSEDRYLMKYDKRWKCYLLPFFRTKIEEDEKSITDNVLKLTGLNITPYKVVEHEDKKYSYSDGFEKKYNHTYYGFNLDIGKSSLPGKAEFKIDKTKYKWFTLDELRNDKTIMKKNGTIIQFVEENF